MRIATTGREMAYSHRAHFMIVDKVLLTPTGANYQKLLFALIAGGILGFAVTGRTQNVVPDQINPPFGFQWGEPEKDIERTINRAQARIVTRDTIHGRDAWTVEGLIQPALKRTIPSPRASGFANTIAKRRSGVDERLASQAAAAATRAALLLALIERQDDAES